MQKHTQEPWLIGGTGSEHQIYVKQDGAPVHIIQVLGDITQPAEDRANAARIVECVNACEGIDKPSAFIPTMRRELKDIREAIGADENESTFDEVERLLSIRNSLLAVLRKVGEGFDTGNISQEHYDAVTELTEKYKHVELPN